MRQKVPTEQDTFIVWMDLENAFGSIKHNLMAAAMKFYNIPEDMIALLMSLYKDCAVKVVTEKWTTQAISVEQGSLQGGPEAGLCFNISWNLGIMFLIKVATMVGCESHDKPIVAFADDITLSSDDRMKTRALVRAAENFCRWAGLNFKNSKCKAMGIVSGSLVNPLIPVNGKIIPAMHKTPFKFLGRLVYPKFDDKEEGAVIDKFLALMSKTDHVLLDNRKKAWLYENGVLPAMIWEFMVYRFTESCIATMESCANRYLKKWLKLCKSADPSILYRKEKGLGIKSVRTCCMKAQVNKEIILSCSRDKTVRNIASERRKSETTNKGKWKPAKKLEDAVQRVTYRHMFKGQRDKRGLGHNVYIDNPVERKELTAEVTTMGEEEMIPHILSLAEQSKWTLWDNIIDLDMKWKEILYGMSPSMLSFILNSIQNTLPHPVNMRRWKIDSEAVCGLCGWKNAGLPHILAGCRIALEQGRISYRHDSILKVIEDSLKTKASTVKKICPLKTGLEPVSFIKKGQRTRKDREVKTGLLDTATDLVVQIDLRQKVSHFPPHITTTSDRPYLVLYSNITKVVIMIELTSPVEDNLEKWRVVKSTKYEKLAESIRDGGDWKAFVFTVEVGARGFVANKTAGVLRRLGLSEKDGRNLTKKISRTAIRSSHFIWICRNTKEWSSPVSEL